MSNISATLDTRAHTEEEKRELQSLNKRFELYILQQREKDAVNIGISRELDEVKKKAYEDQYNAKVRHDEQVNLLQAQTHDVQSHLHQVDTDLAQTMDEVARLEDKLKDKRSDAEDIQNRHRDVLDENTKLKEDVFELQEEVRDLGRKAAAHQKHANDLEKSLPGIEAEAQAVDEEAARDYEKIEEVKKALDDERREWESHSQAHEAEEPIHMHHYLEAAKQTDDERKQALLDDVEVQNKARNAANIATLKHLYEQKCRGYRMQIEKLQDELEKKRAKDTLDTNAVQEEIAKLQNDINGLKEDLTNERQEQARVSAEKNGEIAAIKSAFVEKTHEMDELMELKLLFDVEIQQMEDMLAAEEARLGISNPQPAVSASGSKRQRPKDTPSVSTRASSRLKQ